MYTSWQLFFNFCPSLNLCQIFKKIQNSKSLQNCSQDFNLQTIRTKHDYRDSFYNISNEPKLVISAFEFVFEVNE